MHQEWCDGRPEQGTYVRRCMHTWCQLFSSISILHGTRTDTLIHIHRERVKRRPFPSTACDHIGADDGGLRKLQSICDMPLRRSSGGEEQKIHVGGCSVGRVRTVRTYARSHQRRQQQQLIYLHLHRFMFHQAHQEGHQQQQQQSDGSPYMHTYTEAEAAAEAERVSHQWLAHNTMRRDTTRHDARRCDAMAGAARSAVP